MWIQDRPLPPNSAPDVAHDTKGDAMARAHPERADGTSAIPLSGEGPAERDDRRACHRLAFLTEVSTLLGQSLDVHETLQQLADLAVPWLADWCTIDLLDGGDLRLTAAAHADPDWTATVWRLQDHYGSHDRHGPAEAVRTGQPELLEDVTDELLVFLASNDEHLELMRALRPVSAVAVPLLAESRPLGVITLVWSHPEGRYASEDLPLLQDVANRAAVSVDNASRYAERDRTARLLQQALAPPTSPEPAGLDVAVQPHPADSIGGDFHDVVNTPQGYLVVLGDVGGTGTEAVSLSSVACHTARAAAIQHADPAYVLRMLNEALVRAGPHESVCAATCAHLHIDAQGATLTMASDGHPPLLVRRGDGSVHRIEADSPAGGSRDDPAPTLATLDPGDLLLGHTGGASELRRDGEPGAPDGIAAALRHTAGLEAEATLAEVRARADSGDPSKCDDTTLLAVRLRPEA